MDCRVRDVGDKNASYLAGSNDYLGNTQAPFWSPDSQTIAYCTRSGKTIKKIAADGRSAGQIEVLCNGDGSWNTRGEMLFKAPGGLFLVGENGGEAKQITTDDGAAEDHRHPRFLPDGVRFLFTRRSSSTAKAGVYLGRTDDKRTTRIFPDASMAEYVEAPDGARYIFFVRVADLIAQRVDGDTLAPVALPVRVARRMSMGNSRLPSFSVAPTLLVYRNNVGDSTFVWTDRKGQATGVRYGGTTAMGTPALSHDERTLAFSRLNPDTNLFELWKLDIARGTPQKLYDAPTIVAGPAFSPDDRQLAFTANQSTFIMRLESGEVSEVDCGGPCRGDLVTDWSAVDNRLIRSAGDVTWLTPGHPMPPKMFTKGFHPKLSPDGRWLAYTSSETETPEVYVQRFPDGTRKKVVSVDGGFQPYWRGDGGELFYRNDAGDIMAAQLRLGDEVQVVRTDRLFRERLGDGGNDFSRRDFIVNRDGQRFILNVRTRETPPVTVVRNWAQRLGK